MKKYTFLVDRISYNSREVSIVAQDEETAYHEAHRLAKDIDFSGSETSYEYETTILDD